MGRLTDYLTPREDSVQFILKKKGKPVAALYKKGEDEEHRTPSLKTRQEPDATTSTND